MATELIRSERLAVCFVCSKPIYRGDRWAQFQNRSDRRIELSSPWRYFHVTCRDAAKLICFLERPEHDWYIPNSY